MKFNKLEAIGIGVSVGAMALALWFIRLDSNFSKLSFNTDVDPSAAVIVAQNSDKTKALSDAYTKASTDNKINKMIINDIVVGSGKEVKKGSQVSVHYIGTLQNGQQFDNSYTKGTPLTFTVGKGMVIKGWDEGIVGMKEGGQRILVIPPELAYGKSGGGPIAPNTTLVFALELISVK